MYQKLLILCALLIFLLTNGNAQVSNNTISDFETDLDGWKEGGSSPNPPSVITTGGPSDVDDGFMRNISTGSASAGGKWVLINTSDRWTGDYTNAGIVKINLSVRNSGDSDVHLRMAFENGDDQLSSPSVTVSPSSTWSQIELDISPDQLSAIKGSSDPATVMSNVTTVRLINNADLSWVGAQAEASIDLDNIAAAMADLEGGYTHEAYLSGRHELIPIETLAGGKIHATLSGNTLKVEGSFEGITSQVDTTVGGGMHIHSGIIGINGGVIFPLKADFSEDLTSGTLSIENNTFQLSAEQLSQLEDQLLYVNIHSKDHRSGEIRGQITPKALYTFSANLMGGYENPSVITTGRGSVILSISQDSVLSLSGTFSQLRSVFNASIGGGAHIHRALPGSNGGVMMPIVAALDPSGLLGNFYIEDNTQVVSKAFIEALLNRELYVNIHTATSPGGEIRGQLVPASSRMLFRSHLAGSNEVHLAQTLGGGMVITEVINSDSIGVYGSYSGLEGTLATQTRGGIHIHKGMAGQNGGILQPLINTITNESSGQIHFEDNTSAGNSDMIADLIKRQLYVNIHSSFYPSGELRSQLVGEGQMHFSAVLTPSQEVNTSVSEAWGNIKAELFNNVLTVSGSFQNLSADLATQIRGGAHLHIAPPGSNGGIAFDLTLAVSEDKRSAVIWPDSNRFTLTADQVIQLAKRNFYVNVHTARYSGGELRGQLLFDPNFILMSVLGGSQVAPPVDTKAKGIIMGELGRTHVNIFGSFQGLSSPLLDNISGGVNVYGQVPGKNGIPIINLLVDADAARINGVVPLEDNIIPVNFQVLLGIFNRQLYIKVDTENDNGGELRGQILPLAQNYLMANLLGKNAGPANDSEANGLMLFEYHQGLIKGHGSFDGLEGKLATQIRGGGHIHNAYVGSNGGILQDLAIESDADTLGGVFFVENNIALLDEGQRSNFLSGGKYVNIHSGEYSGGEIRGQILPMNNYYPDASQTSFDMSAPIVIDTTDGQIPVDFNWTSASDFDSLAYRWQWSESETFDNLIFESNLIVGTTQSIASGSLMDTLSSLGFFDNVDVACLYHRFQVTDGSLSSYSSVEQLCFENGVRTNLASDPLLSVTKIGPVPTQNEIQVSIQNYKEFSNQSIIQMEVIDVKGQRLKSERIQLLGPDYRSTIQVDDLSPGTYFLKLNNAIWPFVKM